MKIGGISKLKYEKSPNRLNIAYRKEKTESIGIRNRNQQREKTLKNEIREGKLKFDAANNNIINSKVVALLSGYIEVV